MELLYKPDNQMIDRQAAQFEAERFWVGALKDAVIDGDVEKGSLMAGQSVGLVDKVMPLQEVISELLDDVETELIRLKERLNG